MGPKTTKRPAEKIRLAVNSLPGFLVAAAAKAGSVMTRRFQGDRLLVATHNAGKLEESDSPYGLPKVRTKFKIRAKKKKSDDKEEKAEADEKAE